MPFPKILNNTEIKEFDSPPIFKIEDIKIFFEIPKSMEDNFIEIRTDQNKLIFILLSGYFKYCKKFFIPNTFNEKDINYVVNKYNLKIQALNLNKINRMVLSRYKNLILKDFGISPFDEAVKLLLIQEAKIIVRKKFKLRAIFQGLLDFLLLKQIEIPSYHLLAEIITETVNDYEKELQDKLINFLDNDKKELLNNLLKEITSEKIENKKKRYKITNLKKFSYSTKPFKIRENIESLKYCKNIFDNLKKIIDDMKLSEETINYYAIWSINADSSQMIVKSENKRYLYLISFVIHQYYILNDLLIDILLSVIQNSMNTAKKENSDNYYKNKKESENKVVNIAQSFETKILPSFDELEIILYSDFLSSHEKVEKAKILLNLTRKTRLDAKDNVHEINKEYTNNLKNNDLFDVFNIKSIKLQRRVSEIVKNIDFNKDNSNKKIIEAINYYKLKDGVLTNNVQDDFIDDLAKKEAIYDENGKLRISLYKVFLFQSIADEIRSGRLNIKYSYKYKSINEYLINDDFWKKNKSELLKKTNLLEFQDFDVVIEKLKNIMYKNYKKTNENILNNQNEYISFKKGNDYTLITPKIEKDNDISVSDLFTSQENIPLTDILLDINNITSFLKSFEHHNFKHTRKKPDDNIFFAGITGYGCNIGKSKIAKISKGINENELENTIKWYFNLDNIHNANNIVLAFINSLDLPNIFRKDKSFNHTSSDGQKFALEVDSITGNYSYKYFGKGKGVSVYTFIDERHLLFYSTVISASEREAGYVIDGLLNNNVIKSDIHSTDTHGYTDIIFASTHLLGYSFAPRIKNFKEKTLYCFDSVTKKEFEKKGYKILPNGKNYINLKVLKGHWDDILRFIATIKLKESSASQILRRLSSYSKKNKLYQALNEFGKIIKTIFLLKYIDDLKLRQSIEKQLNKVESSNKFAKAVFFGNNQEFEYVTKEEQDIAEGCKRLIENSIICWNYLYLSQKISDINDINEKNKIINIIKNGSIIFWKHINLYGEYDFSVKSIIRKMKFDISKILELNIA